MAFYNRKIWKNKSLRKAWRAGNQIKLDEIEELCLPEICSEIARWMHQDRAPHKRLSLRSSSILLSGAIRLYRDEVDELLNDVSYFIWRVRLKPYASILRSIDGDILPSGSSDNSDEESFVIMPKAIQLSSSDNSDEESFVIMPKAIQLSSSDNSDEESFVIMPKAIQLSVPARTPSPCELAAHTQSIMQSALIKKELEEQRENYGRRHDARSKTPISYTPTSGSSTT